MKWRWAFILMVLCLLGVLGVVGVVASFVPMDFDVSASGLFEALNEIRVTAARSGTASYVHPRGHV